MNPRKLWTPRRKLIEPECPKCGGLRPEFARKSLLSKMHHDQRGFFGASMLLPCCCGGCEAAGALTVTFAGVLGCAGCPTHSWDTSSASLNGSFPLDWLTHPPLDPPTQGGVPGNRWHLRDGGWNGVQCWYDWTDSHAVCGTGKQTTVFGDLVLAATVNCNSNTFSSVRMATRNCSSGAPTGACELEGRTLFFWQGFAAFGDLVSNQTGGCPPDGGGLSEGGTATVDIS